MYPDDSIQSLFDDGQLWWVKDDKYTLCRGALVYAFINHFDQHPYGFVPVGRTEATEHGRADVKVVPLKVGQNLQQTSLPVAAMPRQKNEIWAAYRAKSRPCLVISSPPPAVDKCLTRGMPNASTSPAISVCPYYGADKALNKRAGYNSELVERIRHCVYPQFFWEKLPLDTETEESILRLDQIQPIGTHYNGYKHTGYRLSEEALEIFDDWLTWLIFGGLPEDSFILSFQEEFND